MDVNLIRETYERMFDEDILRIALFEAKGLRPEAIAIIKDQIKARDLNPNLTNGILAQQKRQTLEDLARYSELIRDLKCPICAEDEVKLNAVSLSTIKSLIFLSFKEEVLVIACPSCLDKRIREANFENAVFGWWSVHGIFLTPSYLIRNMREKKSSHLQYANKTLLKFTLSAIGYIETFKNDPEKLQEILR